MFSRENGLLVSHPFTDGRGRVQRVSQVMSFTGQSLAGPGEATAFLRLSGSAREYPTANSTEQEGRSAAGRAQGVALHVGRGRASCWAKRRCCRLRCSVPGDASCDSGWIAPVSTTGNWC